MGAVKPPPVEGHELSTALGEVSYGLRWSEVAGEWVEFWEGGRPFPPSDARARFYRPRFAPGVVVAAARSGAAIRSEQGNWYVADEDPVRPVVGEESPPPITLQAVAPP